MRLLFVCFNDYFYYARRQNKNEKKKNESNSAADAVQVEANLQEELSDTCQFVKQKCCWNARYLKSYQMLALAVTVSVKQINFIVWHWKCWSRSRRRTPGLIPFDRKCLNVYCWFFFIILTSGTIRKWTNFTYFKHFKSKNASQGYEKNNRTYTVRSQMFECVLLNFVQ